jgi:hypothetical protein
MYHHPTDQSYSLMIIANVTSLEIQVTSSLSIYATSAFKAHSLVATVAVVQNIVSCKMSTVPRLHAY